MRSLISGKINASVLSACLLIVATAQAGPLDPDVWIEAQERWEWSTTGDVISATPVIGDRGYNLYMQVSSGTVPQASAGIYLPNGLNNWWNESPAYVRWDDANKVLSLSTIGPTSTGGSLGGGVIPAGRLATEAPAVAATRWISNPVFTDPNNIEKRAVTLQLNIAPNALAGYTNLNVDLVQQWEFPDGLTLQSVTDANFPAGFNADGASFQINNSSGLGGLSGTYDFSATVEIKREASMQQGTMGDLYFKPPVEVSYNNQTQIAPGSGTSIAMNLDAEANAVFSTSTTVNYQGNRLTKVQDLALDGIAIGNNKPAVPTNILLANGRTRAISGNLVYNFYVGVDGNDMAGGTLTTPGGLTYALTMDEDGGLSFQAESSDSNDLSPFGKGNYVIKVWSSDPNAKTCVVPLTGEYPTEFPAFDQAMGFETSNTKPLLSWAAPTDPNILGTHVGIEQGDDYEYGGFVAPTVLSATPDQDLAPGAVWAEVLFANGGYGDANGVPFLAGFVTCTDTYFNVLPEPLSLSLLACGAAGIILGRRKRR